MVNNKSSGYMAAVVAIAVLAGAAGGLLTLIAAKQLNLLTFGNAPENSEVVEILPPENVPDTQLALIPDTGDADTGSSTSAAMDTAAANRFAELEESVEQGRVERAQLAWDLDQLAGQVSTLEADFINRQARDDIALAVNQVENPSGFAGPSEFTGPSTFTGPGDFTRPDDSRDRVDALVASGIDYERAQDLQSRQNQFQLARLELFDQAEREGWRDSEQFSERLEELDEQRPDLRTELGDDAYDRYLYEAGRNNRVVIESIIPGSAADFAGLQAGDLVVSYAGQRVFSTTDLQQATRAGIRNEPVALNIERQGQILFFEVLRGPLGVSLNPQQRSPS